MAAGCRSFYTLIKKHIADEGAKEGATGKLSARSRGHGSRGGRRGGEIRRSGFVDDFEDAEDDIIGDDYDTSRGSSGRRKKQTGWRRGRKHGYEHPPKEDDDSLVEGGFDFDVEDGMGTGLGRNHRGSDLDQRRNSDDGLTRAVMEGESEKLEDGGDDCSDHRDERAANSGIGVASSDSGSGSGSGSDSGSSSGSDSDGDGDSDGENGDEEGTDESSQDDDDSGESDDEEEADGSSQDSASEDTDQEAESEPMPRVRVDAARVNRMLPRSSPHGGALD